jgi:hypothetical protein
MHHEKTLSCEVCGAKAFKNSEELEDHKKETHADTYEHHKRHGHEHSN